MSDKEHWWTPVLADAKYAEHLRNDYKHDADMSDDDILFKYCGFRKYVTTWDHVGDAYLEYESVVDAYLKLKDQLAIDTLNPNRRAHIIELEKQIRCLDEGQYHLNSIIEERDKQIQQLALANKSLREDVAYSRYEHWQTCDSEGLNWGSDIPKKPKDY